MVNHNRIDVVTDILGEIFEATQNNLTTTVALGTVRNTPIAAINKELNSTAKRSIDLTTKVLGNVTKMLGISTTDIDKLNKKNVSSVVAQYKLKESKALRDDLYRATIQGIAKQPKVQTASGRMWGYKEYMEMNVRTTIAREAGDMQLKFGGEAGVVFYLCNIFEDSADDHADFQGRYYYDERFKEFGYDAETEADIIKHIRKNKILPMQYVRENKPYLGTRPNCRHTFTPVSLNQAASIDPKKLSAQIGTTTGTYKDSLYEATQAQRLNERNIRKYKYNATLSRRLAAETADPTVRDKFIKRAAVQEKRMRYWQLQQRKLIKDNKNLERDYRRETREKVLQDLGVKYNIDDLDVNSNMPEIENVDEVVQEVIEVGFKNKSLSKTARQERDLDKFVHADAVDMLTNTKLIAEWQPMIVSLANDFPEFDVLEAYKIKRTRHTAGTIGVAVRGYDAKFATRINGVAKYSLKSSYSVGFSNPQLKDYDQVTYDVKKHFDLKWSPVDDRRSTLVHEFAHVLDNTLSNKTQGINLKEFLESLPKHLITKNEYDVLAKDLKKTLSMDFSYQMLREYKKTLYGASFSISESIGRYAATNAAEFFAEGFTKWYLSETPDGDFEKTFGEIFYRLREEALKNDIT